MSIILYKPGNTHTINGIKCAIKKCTPDMFHYEIKRGEWKLTPEECLTYEDDTNAEAIDNMTDEEVRSKAYKIRIKSWHLKSIANLKEELKRNVTEI